MDREASMSYMQRLLLAMLEQNGSDLFITAEAAPSIKVNNEVKPLTSKVLTESSAAMLVRSIMNDLQLKQFEKMMECNFSLNIPGKARFRVNAFTQRGCPMAVLRHIPHQIPPLDSLNLPPILQEVMNSRRGLILILGGAGAGKSTTLAALLDHRNRTSSGHIVTIEDPIEFVHEHKKCLVTQRELGVDTIDYHLALKNALRQAPDVIMLGEIRDCETMEHALNYSETGHLCLATLHANSATQAIDRVINFFPVERHEQVLMDLSLNLRALIAQRLVRLSQGEGRIPAVEIVLNSPLIADHILKGDIGAIKETTAKSREQGMQTFDQALYDLIENRKIALQEGFRHADSVNELRLRLKLDSRFSKGNDFFRGTENLAIEPVDLDTRGML